MLPPSITFSSMSFFHWHSTTNNTKSTCETEWYRIFVCILVFSCPPREWESPQSSALTKTSVNSIELLDEHARPPLSNRIKWISHQINLSKWYGWMGNPQTHIANCLSLRANSDWANETLTDWCSRETCTRESGNQPPLKTDKWLEFY